MKYNAVLFDWHQTIKGQTIPGFVRSLISDLYNSGYRLAIVSNSHRYGDARWLRNKIADLGWSQYFDVVISSGGLLSNSAAGGLHKPDPEIYYRALNFMNVPPHKAVFLGDSYRCDVIGPKNIGMQAILVDVDAKDYSADLWNTLDDKPTSRSVITSYDWVSENSIRVYVRDLTEPLSNGQKVLVGLDEFTVDGFSQSHSKEDILDTGGAGYQFMNVILQ